MSETRHTIAFDAQNGGIESAKSALESLHGTIDSDSSALKELESQMGGLKEATVAGGGLKNVSAGSNAATSSMKALAPAAKAGGQSIEQMTYLAKGAMGPMGGLFERATMLAKGLGSLGPAALAVAAAVGVLALTTALVSATVALAHYGLEMSDAALKSRALLEGATGGVKGANAVDAAVSNITAKVPLAGAEVEKLGVKLYKAGLRGQALEDALMKASLEAAGLGKNASPDLIRRRMLGLDIQTMKLKENIARIFSGLKIEGFLTALQDVLSIFNEGASSATALKTIFESLFNPLFGGASTLGPIVKNLFRGMVVGALLVTIAILKVRNALKGLIPGDLLAGINGATIALGVGAAAVVVLVAALVILAGVIVIAAAAALLITAVFFGALLISLALVAVGVLMLLAAFMLIPALAVAAVYGLYKLGEYLMELAGLGGQAAGGIIDGLVDGITSRVGAVMSAITTLAGSMKSALMGALGIASPSKVFAKLGAFTAEGLAQGVEGGEPQVTAATQQLVTAPTIQASSTIAKSQGASRASRGSGGAGPTINIYGVKGAEDLTPSFWANVCELLETAARDGGLEPEPT